MVAGFSRTMDIWHNTASCPSTKKGSDGAMVSTPELFTDKGNLLPPLQVFVTPLLRIRFTLYKLASCFTQTNCFRTISGDLSSSLSPSNSLYFWTWTWMRREMFNIHLFFIISSYHAKRPGFITILRAVFTFACHQVL